MSQLLTPKAAAAALGISTAQLTKLVLDGEIPFINVGRGQKRPSRRFDPADLERFKAVRRKTTADFEALLAEIRASRK